MSLKFKEDIYNHHWSRIIKMIWIFQNRDLPRCSYLYYRSTSTMTIVRFLYILARSIEKCNKNHLSNFDQFSRSIFFDLIALFKRFRRIMKKTWHIFVVFRDRPGLLVSFLQISTRSMDWRNKNWDFSLSHLWCKGTIRGICPKKWMKFEGRILLCHSIDLVKIRKKLIDSQCGSRIITELWRFISRYSSRQAPWFRYYR